MRGRKAKQDAEVSSNEQELNFHFPEFQNLAQSMSAPSLERVQTQVSRHVSSTLEEWRGNSKTLVDSFQNLATQGFPSLSIEAGPGPSSEHSSNARRMATLRNGGSGGNGRNGRTVQGQGMNRPQRRNRRNSTDSLRGARRQHGVQSGSPKTPDSSASSMILSPQSVVPRMRRVMSDTSIENFFKDAKERVVTATAEWSNQQGGGLGSKQGSLENLLSLSSPLSSQSVEQLRKTGTMVHSRSAQALASAQQTLSNIQNNVNLLQLSLQQSFTDGKIAMETRYKQLAALGEPGSLFSSKERLAEIISHDERAVASSPTGDRKKEGPFQKNALRRKQSSRSDASNRSDRSNELTRMEKGDRSSVTKSSLKEEGRNITIVTTAALPWMTGTAVNPLLRAAYLAKDGSKSVNLMVPWLAKSDQQRIFPNGVTFESPEEQEAWVKQWLKKRTGFTPDFKLTFYPGRYAPEKCSILPVGDPTKYVPDSAADVAILEEPEHLTWYHHGRRWTDKFSHVVGVVHTNYLDYARREDGGSSKELLLRHINNWVTRIHCHKVVKLSDAVQDLPRQTTEFVHGVADSFLSVGEKKSVMRGDGAPRFSKGAYFLGKCVWAKGYTELIDLLSQNKEKLGGDVSVDCYGTGEDLNDVKMEAQKRNLNLEFLGARDHLDESLHEYRVFVNPSMSDVVATTSAEALAMGKWLVCAEHPSNAFFSQFNNCLIYRNDEEFVQHMKHALTHEPAPMTAEDKQRLTWEAATERFLNVTELTERDLMPGPLASTVDTAAWLTHNSLCGVEPLRAVAGAGVNTRDNPACLKSFQPDASGGGMFDRR